MTIEQVLFLLIFLLIPVLNFLGRMLRDRVLRPTPEGAEPRPGPTPEPPPRVRMPSASSARVRDRPREAPRPAPPAAAPAPRTRRARLDLGDVRRAVVLLAILGPCQGMAPPATRR